jgi:hypothetical protein
MTTAAVGDYTVEVTGGSGSATNTGALSIAPESLSSTNIGMQLSETNVILSWPTDHVGWKLQVQTNGLNSGNTWLNIPGSDTTNKWRIPMNQTTTGAFFRLIYPGN